MSGILRTFCKYHYRRDLHPVLEVVQVIRLHYEVVIFFVEVGTEEKEKHPEDAHPCTEETEIDKVPEGTKEISNS